MYQARLAEKSGLKKELIQRYADASENNKGAVPISRSTRKPVGGRKRVG
jgi:hypothetical protein